jgi:hypothetical protein
VNDANLGFTADKKSVSRKCQPFKTLTHKEEGYVISLQHCLPNITWLNMLKYLNPKTTKGLWG